MKLSATLEVKKTGDIPTMLRILAMHAERSLGQDLPGEVKGWSVTDTYGQAELIIEEEEDTASKLAQHFGNEGFGV